jgi:hypothetical protein
VCSGEPGRDCGLLNYTTREATSVKIDVSDSVKLI